MSNDADPNCQLCHGQGTRMVTGHTFNPALGRPLAIVWCECRYAVIEERQRVYRAELDARLDAHFAKFAPVIKAINAGLAATSSGRKSTELGTTVRVQVSGTENDAS